MFYQFGNRLIRKYDNEIVWIEPWGEDSLRVRATKNKEMGHDQWALTTKVDALHAEIEIDSINKQAFIRNGKVSAKFSSRGHIIFTNDKNQTILEEYLRERAVLNDDGYEDPSVEVIRAF